MKMNMIAGLPPTKLINKFVSKQALDTYFKAPSIEKLIMDLRKLRRSGYLDFNVRVSAEYFEWQRDRIDLKIRADVLRHPDPFGIAYNDEYGLSALRDDTDQGKPLSEQEIIKVISTLPSDVAEKYLEIQICNLDRDEMKKLIPKAKQKKRHEDIEYKGLKISNARVTYLDQQIDMQFREIEALRIFMQKYESLVPANDFISNPDIFSPKKEYPYPHKTCSKLVHDISKKLSASVGQKCIYNQPLDGWRLKIA
jgi:hypothetical protein